MNNVTIQHVYKLNDEKHSYVMQIFEKEKLVNTYDVDNINVDSLTFKMLFNLFSRKRKYKAILHGIIYLTIVLFAILIFIIFNPI